MNFLYVANDFLEWFELYKGHVFLALAIMDSYLVYKISQMDQEKLKANMYLSTHLKYGVAKTNAIKIGIALFAFLFPPTIRGGATLFSLTIILGGFVIINIYFFIVSYCKTSAPNS